MLSNKDIYYFNKAKEISKLSDFNRIHIGCIAIYKGHIISVGYNTNKTNPIQKEYNKYRDLDWNGIEPKAKLHAEIMCLNSIKNIDIKWNKVKLYIYREDSYGRNAIVSPCKACRAMIKSLGIHFINYTTNGGYITEYID